MIFKFWFLYVCDLISLERVVSTLQELVALDALPIPGYTRMAYIMGIAPPEGLTLETVAAGVKDDEACSFPKLQIPGDVHMLPSMEVVSGEDFAKLEVPLGVDMVTEHLINAYTSKFEMLKV